MDSPDSAGSLHDKTSDATIRLVAGGAIPAATSSFRPLRAPLRPSLRPLLPPLRPPPVLLSVLLPSSPSSSLRRLLPNSSGDAGAAPCLAGHCEI